MQIKLAEHWCYLRENRISNVATWLHIPASPEAVKWQREGEGGAVMNVLQKHQSARRWGMRQAIPCFKALPREDCELAQSGEASLSAQI